MDTLTNLLDAKGVPLNQQHFTWKELVGEPISKLDEDAFTRVRIILMNGIELDAVRLKHLIARVNGELRIPLAQVRRVEQHQATMINWLLSADHSPLETTIAYEQTAIEVTAAVAQTEPDPYHAQTYRFGLLEDFDHLYRYAALLDRTEGKDANNILQSYTDIVPGRPTRVQHRAPENDIRTPYNAKNAALVTKLHAALITAVESQTHDYYMNIGPTFSDPAARALYAEIASMEEQHVTQYGSLASPAETLLEKWLIHEAMEAYTYYSCVEQESNPRIKAIWERFLDYEIGHLNFVSKLIEQYEQRSPQQILAGSLPKPVEFKSQRGFVRQILTQEIDLRTNGEHFVPSTVESVASKAYRAQVNAQGSPSDTIAAGYQWAPGTELKRKIANV